MSLDHNNADAPKPDLAQVIAQCEELAQRAKGADCAPDELGYAVKQWLVAKAPDHNATNLATAVMEKTGLPRIGKNGWIDGVSADCAVGQRWRLEELALQAGQDRQSQPPAATTSSREVAHHRHKRLQLLARQVVRDVTDPFDRLRIFSMEAEDDSLGRISERVANGYLEQAEELQAVHPVEDSPFMCEPGVPIQAQQETWILDGLLPAHSITLLAAPGDSGKTGFCFVLAAALARGDTRIWGRKLDPDLGPALLVTSAETSESRLQGLARLTGLLTDTADGPTPHYWRLKAEAIEAGGRKLEAALRQARQKAPHALGIIDSATAVFRLDGNNRQEIGQAFAMLRRVGGSWLLIHHLNKDKDHKGADRLDGSTAWADRSDRLVIGQRRDGALELTATRRGPRSYLSVPLDWIPPDQQDEAPQEDKRLSKQDQARQWMDAHVEDTLAKVTKDLYGQARADGLQCSQGLFYEARKNWQQP